VTPQSKVHLPNMTVDTDDVDILKQQVCIWWLLLDLSY